jgi:hypothetical protein
MTMILRFSISLRPVNNLISESVFSGYLMEEWDWIFRHRDIVSTVLKNYQK